MKSLSIVIIFAFFFSGCVATNQNISLNTISEIDITGVWNVSYTSKSPGVGSKARPRQGVFEINRDGTEYLGFFSRELQGGVRQRLVISLSDRGTILLKGTDLEMAAAGEKATNVDPTGYKPDNFEAFYDGNDNKIRIRFWDGWGNKGYGTMKRNI